MTKQGQRDRPGEGGLLRDILRGFVAGLVIAMIAVTGQLVAAEKGRADPSLSGFLCLSGSLVMVAEGQDGAPDGTAHICPDALLVALDAATPVPAFGGWQLVFDHGEPRLAAAGIVTTTPEAPPPARGPPILV